MKAGTVSLGAILLAMAVGDANAALSEEPAARRPVETGIQLAQAREVEIYYDRNGNEVLVDALTGDVVAVRRPRGDAYGSPAERRAARREQLRGNNDTYQRRELLGDRLQRELEDVLRDDGQDARFTSPRESYPRERFGVRDRYDDYDYRDDVPAYPDEPARPPRPRAVERQPLQPSPQPAPGIAENPRGVLPPQDGQVATIPAQPETVIEPATPGEPAATIPAYGGKGASEDVAKIQILLDRAGLSPGVIDGRMGDNVNKAISAYREKTGNTLRTYDKVAIEAALAESGGDAFTDYEITPVDAAGPYVASVPEDYGEKAKLDRMSFTSVTEMLAERFHMDEGYLKALNPGVNFNRPGTIVKVVNPGKPVTGTVTRIVADKPNKQVRAYGADGKILAIYPSTIGSNDTPSPSGTVQVERVAFNPNYTYNPKINFKQGENHDVLTIPPGPNGPVGTIWIALSKPTYGIHGTPEPSKIGKTNSHGCVRLTNWDAEELAKMVAKGVTVEFIE